MKFRLHPFFLIYLIVFFLSCCKKSDGSPEKDLNPTKGDVYCVGSEENANGISVAKLWKNGEAVMLTDGKKNAHANAVFVSGSDVYIAGHEMADNGGIVAKLWKNTAAVDLSDGQNIADALSVYVYGADVYVAGFVSNITGSTATLWKNGIATVLGSGVTHNNKANSVFVSDGNVYVAGFENPTANVSIAKLWKNGIEFSISDGLHQAGLNAVFVSGNDVYLAGYENTVNEERAILWKNGVPVELSIDYELNAVFVKDKNVFLTGKYVGSIPALSQIQVYPAFWKNNLFIPISQDSLIYQSHANAVFVSADKEYIAGNYLNSNSKKVASIWVNGKLTSLTSGVHNAYLSSIFVK
mgnify:CR=1 FL=1